MEKRVTEQKMIILEKANGVVYKIGEAERL